jgi:GntR family transcriptional regulator, transcriptional repressor for pyruvate dehydrogenase complex
MTDVLEHRKLYEQVVERIRQRILAGELKSGDQLPNERSLGERYGVSRTVIREAVKTLIQNGLVEVRRGQGTFVVDGTADALKESLRLMMGFASEERRAGEMVEVRELLEPDIAAAAARRRSEEDLANLRAAINEMDAALGDAQRFIEADNRFHVALAVATQNHFIPRLLDSVVDLLQEMRAQIFEVTGGPIRGQQHHRVILAAVEAGDAEGARAAMLSHLAQVRQDGLNAVRLADREKNDGEEASGGTS